MRRATLNALVLAAAIVGFLFFIPVMNAPQYQAQAQACASEPSSESPQAEPENFEPCVVPEFGSVTFVAFGAGGAWMEDDYAHYYVVCAGPANCT